MNTEATATLPERLNAGDGTKAFGIRLNADSYSVRWDIGLVSASEDTRASIKIPIWEIPVIKEMLAQPFGAPIKLTRDQATEIVKDSFGGRPDLPEGREYVRNVRLTFGESILRKLSGKSG
jgi:hypothetical protein